MLRECWSGHPAPTLLDRASPTASAPDTAHETAAAAAVRTSPNPFHPGKTSARSTMDNAEGSWRCPRSSPTKIRARSKRTPAPTPIDLSLFPYPRESAFIFGPCLSDLHLLEILTRLVNR